MSKAIFISHSRKDRAAALAVCSALESSGVQCWIAPRDIVAGVKWAEAIAEALGRSAALALILTESSNDSPNVADEINLAKKFNVPIVSIRVEDVEPGRHLELFLTSSHWFEAHPPPLDRHLSRLVGDIHRLVQLDGSREPTAVATHRDRKSEQETTADPPADDSALHRELLFGVVAAQFDFISQQQFLAVCAEWCATKSDSLGQMLVSRQWIEEEDRRAIEALHARKLAKHRGNAPAALWASSDGVLRDVIRQSESPEISRSLDGLRPQPGDAETVSPFEEISRQSRFMWTRLHRTGGLGHIWLADDTELKRPVAIKMLPPDKKSPEAHRMLLNEARIAGRLEHPNIVPVYEVGRREKDDEPFYVMRLLRGETLSDAISKTHAVSVAGRIDSAERRRLLNVFADVCDAVAYAHSQGVCHLDLKPDNVIVGMFNEVNLLDWGLARELDRNQDVHSLPRGTPAYMAPEQAAGKSDQIGTRTDVYGLGSILFEILTGRPPHTGDDAEDLLRRIASQKTPSPNDAQNKVPVPLVQICEKAMAFDCSDRYASVIVLAEEIQSYLRDEPLTTYRANVSRARNLCEKNPDSEAYRDHLARSLMNLGIVLDGMERFDEAEQGLQDAIEQYRKLKEQFGENLQYRVNFAAACLQRRTALEALDRPSEAEQMSRDALWEYEDIIRKSPKRGDFVSIYETAMMERGASEDEVKKRVEEIAVDAETDSAPSSMDSADSTLQRPLDRWVVPDSLHTLLFAATAVQMGLLSADQLQEAVGRMLHRHSLPLAKQLLETGLLDQQTEEQVNACVRRIIRSSDIEPNMSTALFSGEETTSWKSSGPRTMRVSAANEEIPSSNTQRPREHPAPLPGQLTTGTMSWREPIDLTSWHLTDVDRFEILEYLGRGGAGRVSLARDREALRYAALKELDASRMEEAAIERFLFEARFAASAPLPGTPSVYAIGQFPDGRPFYAMQYVNGRPIDELLHSDESFTLVNAVRSLITVADCLQIAHQNGFVHRDVKPKHILVDENRQTFFTDWGLVKCLEPASGMRNEFCSALATLAPAEHDGLIAGTPAFMSPEQATGKMVGPASDIFSLGATLYQLLTGKPPHGRLSIVELLKRISSGNIQPPSRVAGDLFVPKELDVICMRALARDPEDRYPAAEDFAEAMRLWLRTQSHFKRPTWALRNWFKRHPRGEK